MRRAKIRHALGAIPYTLRSASLVLFTMTTAALNKPNFIQEDPMNPVHRCFFTQTVDLTAKTSCEVRMGAPEGLGVSQLEGKFDVPSF